MIIHVDISINECVAHMLHLLQSQCQLLASRLHLFIHVLWNAHCATINEVVKLLVGKVLKCSSCTRFSYENKK